MDTVTVIRPSHDDSRPAQRARLELAWSLRHTRGQAATLAARWVVVDDEDAHQAAA